MSVERSLAAARRASNVSAELWFDMQHVRYAATGRAKIGRGYFPVAGAPGKMRPSGPGDVDFFGTAGGVPVAFDLKVHRTGTYSLDAIAKPEAIRQTQFLLDFGRCGGVGFLALLDPDEAALYLVGRASLEALLRDHALLYRARARNGPWSIVRGARDIVRVPEADTLTVARTGIRYDWLAAVPRLTLAPIAV